MSPVPDYWSLITWSLITDYWPCLHPFVHRNRCRLRTDIKTHAAAGAFNALVFRGMVTHAVERVGNFQH